MENIAQGEYKETVTIHVATIGFGRPPSLSPESLDLRNKENKAFTQGRYLFFRIEKK